MSIQRDRSTQVGYHYVHSLVDDHSQVVYGEVLGDEKGATRTSFLKRAIDCFAAHGSPIERLMTDNAGAYRYSLCDICAEHASARRLHQTSLPWAAGSYWSLAVVED